MIDWNLHGENDIIQLQAAEQAVTNIYSQT